MKRDPTFNPAAYAHTPWQQQWTPQIALERDCCDLLLTSNITTPPDPDCRVIDDVGRATLEANRQTLKGAYEALIPWGYQPCPGRMQQLHAVCFLALHVEEIWKSFQRMSDSISKALACHDANFATVKAFFATKVDGSGTQPSIPVCCPATWIPPAIGIPVGGPSGATCAETECYPAPPNVP
jgi:hypothetical protein